MDGSNRNGSAEERLKKEGLQVGRQIIWTLQRSGVSPGELHQQRHPRKLLEKPGWLCANLGPVPTCPLPGVGAGEPTWDCWPSPDREPPSTTTPPADSPRRLSAEAVFLSFCVCFMFLVPSPSCHLSENNTMYSGTP